MGSSGTPPEAQAHRHPRRLAVRSLDVKAPSLTLRSRTRMSSTQAIVSCAPYAGPVVPMTPRWRSRRFPPFLAAPCSRWNGFRTWLCYGASGVVASLPPQPCAAAICSGLPRSCPPIHPRAAATLLVGLGSRFRRHDRAGTVRSAHGDALRRRRACRVTAPGGTRSSATAPLWLHHLPEYSLSKI